MGSNQEVFASGPHRVKITSIICPLVHRRPWEWKPAPHRSKSNGCDQIQKTPFVDHFMHSSWSSEGDKGNSVWFDAHRPLEAAEKPAGMWCDNTLQSLVWDSSECGSSPSPPPRPSISPFHLVSSKEQTKGDMTPACCCCFARAAGLSHFSSDFSGFNPKTPPAQN